MRRVLAVLLVLLLVVAGAAVGGAYFFDGRLRAEAADRVSTQLKASAPFTVKPTVTIKGYPFAWHVITRRFPSVRVQGAEMPVEPDASTRLSLYEVDVTLRDVVPGTDAVTAAGLTGTGRLSYADLGRLAQSRVSHAGGDRLTLERDVDVYGLKATLRLTGRPSLDAAAQTLTLADPEVDVAGVRIPAQASRSLVEAMLKPAPVPLPYGLRIDALNPVDNGVVVGFRADDVRFPLR